MPELKDFIKGYRESKGWTKVEIAAKIGISSQRYGKYEAGKMKPKTEFYDGWEKAFGQDLRQVLKQKDDPNVSRGAKKLTPVHEPSDNPIKKDPVEENQILIRNLDRMGEVNEFLLVELKRYKERFGNI